MRGVTRRAAERSSYSVDAKCPLLKYNLTLNGKTGALELAPASANPRSPNPSSPCFQVC